MKFQNPAAFENHLKESFPNHLSQLFLLISPCDYEKRLWLESIAEILKKKDSQLQVIRFQVPEAPAGVILDELKTPTLWGGMRMIVVNGIDKVRPLGSYLALLKDPMPDVVLVFCAAATKAVAELYQRGKKEMIALDVTEEKPWDRDRRVQEWIKSQVQKEEKMISSDVCAEIVHHLGADLATLDQELKKLMTYVGTKKVIDRADVDAICGSKDRLTGWQLAETVVWKNPVSLETRASDLNFVFPFLGQIRYHLQVGAQLASLIERKMSSGDLRSYFPSLRGPQIDKFIPIATHRGSAFFLRGLLKLFDLELTAKSSSIDLKVALDLFQARLYEKTDLAS